MKKILILLLTSFLLLSCWAEEVVVNNSKETETVKKPWLRTFPWEDFSVKIPAAWNNITGNKEMLPTPSNWEIELAITSSETKNGFSNNLIILSQKLENPTNSKDYSITNNIGSENEYLNYFKKASKEFSFNDSEKSMIYIFNAKYSEETPLLTFLQTAYVCENNKAFFLTIALPLDISDTLKYEEMLATFKCK